MCTRRTYLSWSLRSLGGISLLSISLFGCTKAIQIEVELDVAEPFDICAPTDGELSPDRLKGHAMDSKPYGCM